MRRMDPRNGNLSRLLNPVFVKEFRPDLVYFETGRSDRAKRRMAVACGLALPFPRARNNPRARVLAPQCNLLPSYQRHRIADKALVRTAATKGSGESRTEVIVSLEGYHHGTDTTSCTRRSRSSRCL